MSLHTMSSTMQQVTPRLPQEVSVKRSDPVYNAHAYLTKVPVAAIEPFIEALTKPGDLVLDLFAGSGMTGVAAAMRGRRAMLVDISQLGRHIGTNYLNLVDPQLLRSRAGQLVAEAKGGLGDVYALTCDACGRVAELSKRTWSVIVACQHCGEGVNYYEALEAAGWSKQRMACQSCGEILALRGGERVAEAPVLDTIICTCSPSMRDQPPTASQTPVSLAGLSWPDVAIGAERQMFRASAL